MSLGGLALAIGVLVDAAIVMVENGHRHVSEYQEQNPGPLEERTRFRLLLGAAKQVGPALFFSLLIIIVSFLPVFLLEAQEGRMFRPLAWTKTLAETCSSILSITLVPVLMTLLIGGVCVQSAPTPSRGSFKLISAGIPLLPHHRAIAIILNVAFVLLTPAARVPHRKPVHAAAVRGLDALYADGAARHRDLTSDRAPEPARPHIAHLS